jgi:hypothetical protein
LRFCKYSFVTTNLFVSNANIEFTVRNRDISYNQITGEIPYNIGFLQVATLSLQGNRLTGKIPEVIGLMQALAVLDLSENELVGPIPPILGNLSYTGKL